MDWAQRFEQQGLHFSWPELKIGWLGYAKDPFHFTVCLDEATVVDYAARYLSQHEDESHSSIWGLGSLLKPYDREEISLLLWQIAKDEEEDLLAYYKWRWLLVNQLVTSCKRATAINGLLEISEFWLDLHSPPDMPFVYQSRIANVTPKDYYTPLYFDQVLADHCEWLEMEFHKFKC